MAEWKLFYDGGCNLCHTSQLKLESWAKRAGQPLMVDLLASDEAIAKGYGSAMVLEVDGKPYFAWEAWLEAIRVAPWYIKWLRVLRLTAPTRWLVKTGYGIVEKYRIKWFGSRACQIPAKDQATPAPQ